MRTRLATSALAVAACAAPSTRQPADAQPPPHSQSQLIRAAEDIVGFLRGTVSFDRIATADSVTLYLSPEGGGARATLSRELLRDPANWSVRSSASGATYPFAPPPGMTGLTARVGTHFNCLPYPLSSRAPELAALPHVGTKLEADGAGGCLRTWNLTFVFDPHERTPTLLAVIYDQWEW